MILKTSVFLILAIPALAFAKVVKSAPKVAAKAEANPAKEVTKVLSAYRQAPSIQAKVKKTVEQETLQTSNTSSGKFYFSKGKMRLEMSEPERTVLVYDGKNIWFESRADEEHVVVNKIKGSEFRRSDSLLAALFDKKDALKKFDLKSRRQNSGKTVFLFAAKDRAKSDVLSLEIALLDKNIQRISYTDQIDNKVTLEFSDVSKGKVPADKFIYKPPKGAEISEQ